MYSIGWWIPPCMHPPHGCWMLPSFMPLGWVLIPIQPQPQPVVETEHCNLMMLASVACLNETI